MFGPSTVNIYGDGVHMIAYQINDTQKLWAHTSSCTHKLPTSPRLVPISITQREAEEGEMWRIPRTSTLVYKGRAAREPCVVCGVDACKAHDETV